MESIMIRLFENLQSCFRKQHELINSFKKNTNLIELIKKDKSITSLISEKKIDKVFTYSKHLKNVNYIFRRVFK